MTIIKRIQFIIFLTVIFSNISLFADKRLLKILNSGNNNNISKIFKDKSYTELENYFRDAKESIFIANNKTSVIYKVKFSEFAEIGVISFKKDSDNLISDLTVTNQLRPIFYINKFNVYRIKELKFKIGDGEFILRKGLLYRAEPKDFFFAFHGEIYFRITPSSKEERITLKRKFKKEFLKIKSDRAVFTLKASTINLKERPDAVTEKLPVIFKEPFTYYKNTYGKKIKQFRETWYLSSGSSDSLALIQKEKSGLYIFNHMPQISPDTVLEESPLMNILLSYNQNRSMKISMKKGNKSTCIKLNLFIVPESEFIAGTAIINYKFPTDLVALYLNRNLSLTGIMNNNSDAINVMRRGSAYYLLGSEKKKLSLYYKGKLKPGRLNSEVFRTPSGRDNSTSPGFISSARAKPDKLYFISRSDNFYPNPGFDFISSKVSVTVPSDLNCLASGKLVSKKKFNRNVFTYSADKTKGISLAIGKFQKYKRVNSAVPLNIYSYPGTRTVKLVNLSKLDKIMRFLCKNYGPPCSDEVNILIRSNHLEGGLSNCGMIIMNINPGRKRRLEFLNSPVTVTNSVMDYFSHELAHQWWGGVISWASASEAWFIEGMAQFSTLDFAMSEASERKKTRYLKKIKKWICRHNQSGPVIYGRRILRLEKNYNALQSIIYNKSLMIFYMAKQIMGEEHFYSRLRTLLKKNRFKSLNSQKFIRKFSGDSQKIKDFFNQWVYSRKIPEVKFSVKKTAGFVTGAEIVQKDSSVIFPVKVVLTFSNNSKKTLQYTVSNKREDIVFNEKNIRKAELNLDHTLAKKWIK